jgi:hypothetical protein
VPITDRLRQTTEIKQLRSLGNQRSQDFDIVKAG